MTLVDTFCTCIRKVKKTLKQTRRKDKLGRSIAICVRSVLQSRGKTLKKFNCKKKVLQTQALKN